jgi:hypothetical protein
MKPAVIPWTQPGWRQEATEWIEAELARLGLALSEPIDRQRERPWSTIWRLPVGGANLYFKATSFLANEAAILSALARWRPNLVPAALAADAGRRWLIMADAGEPLRPILQAKPDLGPWRQILPCYAALQLEMAERADELLALGALDRRLQGLPAHFEELLRHPEALVTDRPDSLTAAQLGQLRRRLPAVRDLCRRLADFGLPETLEHSDLHDGNLFVRDGRYILVDWGDTAIAHPFFCLNVALPSAAVRMGLEPHDPAINDLQELYLDRWGAYGPPDLLRACAKLAYQVGLLNRALTFWQVVSHQPPAERQTYARFLHQLLTEFLATLETSAGH